MKLKNLFLMGLAATALAACSNDNENLGENAQSGVINFQSVTNQLNTRLADDASTWNEGDAIGIYMLANGTSNVMGECTNVKYTAAAAASSCSFNSESPIKYKTEYNTVDFVAYYPYKESFTDNVYNVDLSDQSAGTAALDLMYASSTGYTGTSTSVSLSFQHALSKLQFVLTGDALSGATSVTTTVTGLANKATFNVLSQIPVVGSVGSITTYEATAGTNYNAMVAPGSASAGVVTIDVDETNYTWNFSNAPALSNLDAGKAYTITLTLGSNSGGNETTGDVEIGFIGELPTQGSGSDSIGTGEESSVIPSNYVQYMVDATSETIKSAIEGATTDTDVAIVLTAGNIYNVGGAISVPSNITSLMIVCEDSSNPAIVVTAGEVTLNSTMTQLYFYGVDLSESTSRVLFNQSTTYTIDNVIIENCSIHDYAGLFRLRDTSKITSLTVKNSVVYNIDSYCLFRVDADTAALDLVTCTNSTFYGFTARVFYFNKQTSDATVNVDHCTFYNAGIQYALAQTAGSGYMALTNSILGGTIKLNSSFSITDNTGTFYTSAYTYTGTALSTNDADTFADAANGDFTLSSTAKSESSSAGDPRWY